MSRIVPLYIDFDTGKYAVRSIDIDGNFRTYRLDVSTPSNSWVITHNLNTYSVLVKIYQPVVGTSPTQYREIIPDTVVLTSSSQITATFSENITGQLHLMVWDIGSYQPIPSPTPTVTPTITPTVTPSSLPAFDIGLSTLSSTVSFTNATSIAFSNSGSKAYLLDANSLDQYTLSTPWDLSTATYDSAQLLLSLSEESVWVNDAGTKAYIAVRTSDRIDEFTLSIAHDITSASLVNSFTTTPLFDDPNSVQLSTDGTKMYIHGQFPYEIYQYTLSIPFDTTTATYDSVKFATDTNGSTDPRGFTISSNGVYLIVVDAGTDVLYQHSMSTPWDLSTATFDSTSVSSHLGGISGSPFPLDVRLSSTGNKAYIADTNENAFFYYDTNSSF